MAALDVDSVASRIVVRKLERQLAEGTEGVAAVAVRSLMDDPDLFCLVGECRELEECFGTHYTDAIVLTTIWLSELQS